MFNAAYIKNYLFTLKLHVDLDASLMSPLFISCLQEDLDIIGRDDQQRFLESADFLHTYGLPALKSNVQAAAKEVLQG